MAIGETTVHETEPTGESIDDQPDLFGDTDMEPAGTTLADTEEIEETAVPEPEPEPEVTSPPPDDTIMGMTRDQVEAELARLQEQDRYFQQQQQQPSQADYDRYEAEERAMMEMEDQAFRAAIMENKGPQAVRDLAEKTFTRLWQQNAPMIMERVHQDFGQLTGRLQSQRTIETDPKYESVRPVWQPVEQLLRALGANFNEADIPQIAEWLGNQLEGQLPVKSVPKQRKRPPRIEAPRPGTPPPEASEQEQLADRLAEELFG